MKRVTSEADDALQWHGRGFFNHEFRLAPSSVIAWEMVGTGEDLAALSEGKRDGEQANNDPVECGGEGDRAVVTMIVARSC